MKKTNILSQLFISGLILTVVSCAQNPRTADSRPVDSFENGRLEAAPISEEPPVYSIPKPYKKPKSSGATKKPAKAAKSTAYLTHTVKSGENLYRIALHYGVSQAAIKSANALKSNTLKLGQKLRIPGGKTSNTPLLPLSRQVAHSSTKTKVIVPKKNIASCSPAPKWGWPSQGKVTRSSAMIDIKGDAQPLKAAASGMVTYSGQGTQRPNRITISHGKYFSTVYEYYGTSLAVPGTQVTLGQTLGQLKAQTSLRFEIRCHAKALDPLYYLPG